MIVKIGFKQKAANGFFAFFFLCASVAAQPDALKDGLEATASFGKVGQNRIFADLQKGDSKAKVLEKLKQGGFREISEEKPRGIVRCDAKLNGFRYELVCHFEKDLLKLCVVEGRKGWQFSFYEETLRPQWKNLRDSLVQRYGAERTTKAFPKAGDIPLNDPAGVITDVWELDDRMIILAVQLFEIKDCCTNRLIEYTTCLAMVQPK